MKIASLLCSAIVWCCSAWAAVPSTIGYQGFLTSANGTPVDGAVVMTFRLYAADSGGSPLWTETQLSVNVSGGVFEVVLGSLTPLTPLAFDVPYWLTTAINADGEMSPRQPLVSTPYALHAARADALSVSATIAGAQVTGSIAGSQIVGTLGNATVPGAVPWNIVAGSSQTAAANRGYVVTNAGLTTITLPGAPAVGDAIKVSSPYDGGFVLVPGAGQTIDGINVFTATNWIARDSIRNWIAIASSSDGTKLIAADSGGLLYTSTDSGANWTPRNSARAWRGVASSADGTKLVAVEVGGLIYTSVDSGIGWSPHDSARSWTSVASSADGTKLVATVFGGQIYTSTDSGLSWFPRDSVRAWLAVTSSADGAKLVAAEIPSDNFFFAQLYTSTNSGINWTPTGVAADWKGLASSADGTKLVAVSSTQVYTSTDSGVMWTPHEAFRDWRAVASSADGTKLVALVGNGQIYRSADSGLSWTPKESNRSWSSVTSSADGIKLAATATGSQIFTVPTAPFSGQRYTSVELVYAGGSKWIVANQQGVLSSP